MASGRAALLLGVAFAFVRAESTVKPLRVHGVITAVFTPYDMKGSLNLAEVPAMAQFQKKMGAKGVFVGGTTGDSLALSMSERKALNVAWASAAKANDLLFIVHVGAEALADARELSTQAEQLGAAAIGCMSSVFFKPATVEAEALWLQQVGLAAPTLPLYYYHIPSMTGVDFMMLDLIKAIEKVGVPTFVGVKYTGLYENNAFPDFEKCTLYAGGRYEIFCGREEMTLEALSVGAHGFIGSQFNFAADLYGKVAEAFPKNITRAREIQALGLDLIDAWRQAPPGVNGNRMVMDSTRVAVGPARLPSLQPDSATAAAMRARITAWCAKAASIIGKSETIEMCKASAIMV